MFTITKEFEFSASHQLNHLPEGHMCARLHGHNYKVVIELQAADLDERGFVLDYGELAALKVHIDRHFDHRHLNDVIPVYPTAENLARYFYGWAAFMWPQVVAVRVSETPKTWAEFRKEPKK